MKKQLVQRITVFIFLLVSFGGCTDPDRTRLYSDLVDELISRGDIFATPATDEEEQQWDVIWSRYEKSHFDQTIYKHLLDTTLRAMKHADPRWQLRCAPEMAYSTYWDRYGATWLDGFIGEDFPRQTINSARANLSQSGNITTDSLNVSYLDIQTSSSRKSNDPCLLIFSKSFFNKARDKALVSYEWCDRGEIILAIYSYGKWRIEKTVRTFDH